MHPHTYYGYEIPANNNPTPAKIIATIAVLTGNAITIIPKISASNPSLTVPNVTCHLQIFHLYIHT
jgi:hypothetical protein